MSAILGDVITQSRSLFTDLSITIKNLTFDSPHTYVLAGQGSLEMEADTGDARLNVLRGSQDVRIQVNLNSNLNLDVAAGSMLTFNNGLDLNGYTLAKTGDGDLVINNRLILDGGMITGVVINNAAGVPEPSTLVLVSLALLTLGPGSRQQR